MQKHVLLSLFSSVLLVIFTQTAHTQGCVAIRQMGGCNSGSASAFGKGQWQVGANYRYFRSYKHFRGDSEQVERVENGTEVININHSFDFGVSYAPTNRLSLTATLPLIFYDRSSLYEHYGNSLSSNPEQKRFHTGANGIGDLRVSANYWLFNPETSVERNISLGLGIKLPTGNENVQDEFHKRKASDGSDSIVVKAVDQSIQLGDGGVGVSLELQAYTSLFENALLYANGFYLSNPQNTNKTLNRGTLVGVDPLIAYHSIADQYMARIGMTYVILPTTGLFANLGGRIEGIPAKDLIGKSEGWRRPGYVVSAEPGLSFQHHDIGISLNVPLALYRNRVKNTYDLADPTGQRHGDAAFADYSINVGFTWRFGGRHQAMPDQPAIPKWKEAKN